MPITPDDMPDFPDDQTPDNRAPNGAAGNGSARTGARMAAPTDTEQDMVDDAGDIDTAEDDDLEEAPGGQSFSDMVRQSPIGALIGAFVAGFLIARLI